MANVLRVTLLGGVIVAACLVFAARAQDSGGKPGAGPAAPGAAKAVKGTQPPTTLFEIIFSGGLVGVLIMLSIFALSFAAVALVIEHSISIRQKVVMPPGLADRVHEQLAAGNLAAADKACQEQPSFLAFVIRMGLSEAEGGWTAVEKAMEDAVAEQAARLYRKIEFLTVIGNIAPMLGLLGTVTGMIIAFKQVAESQGSATAADLAEGIYQALVTTVGGLVVAIPALGAFALFRNKVDQFIAEAAYQSQHAMGPLKRRLAAGPVRTATPVAARSAPPPPSPPRSEGTR